MSAKKTESDPKADGKDETAADSAETSAEGKAQADNSEIVDEPTVTDSEPGTDDVADADQSELAEDSAEAEDTEQAAEPLEDDAAEFEEASAEIDLEAEAKDTGDEPAQSEETQAAQPVETLQITERVVERRGGFVPMVIGGVIAGLVGFAAGSSGLLAPYMSSGSEPAVTEEAVNALNDRLAALEARVDGLPPAPDLSGIEAQLQSGLTGQADALSAVENTFIERLDMLDARLTELAQAPVEAAVSAEAVAAYERELAAVQDALSQQRSEIEEMIAEAAEMESEATENATRAQGQAAAARLFAALESGSAFSGEIEELTALGVSIPEALTANSDGVATLPALQSDFPELARTALARARDEEGGGGLTGFVQRQLGARSVTPREGDDPDAILSRAEAALTGGDLQSALTEISALPDVAQDILSNWTERAAGRLAAIQAADELAASLRSN